MMEPSREELVAILSEGLDLCVRARKLEAIDCRAAALAWSSDPEAWQEDGLFDKYVARNNAMNPNYQIETRCLTPMLWAEEQYQADLADWEKRARAMLHKEIWS